MRHHALIMKPRLKHFIQTCEQATPRFGHKTSTNILFKLVNMRHHALIMKPRLKHFIQTCEHATPRFDHETSTRTNVLFKLVNKRHHAFHKTSTNILFKLVNMRHHALIMKPRLKHFIQTCEHATPRFDHET